MDKIDRLERLRQLVANKNVMGSIRLARSRLTHCDSNGAKS